MTLNDINILLFAIGGTLLFLELTSGYLKFHLYISEPIIATFIGILIGPYLLNVLDIRNFEYTNIFIEEAARLTLAITLMGVAFRLPHKFILENWKDLLVLIGIILPLMFIISGLLIYFIIGLPLMLSLLIGAIISPTDPVLAGAIVTSETAQKHIPKSLRNIISSESAVNDALALPMVMIPFLLINFSTGEAVKHLLLDTLLFGTVGAVICGIILGYLTARLLIWITTKAEIETPPLLSTTLALALASLGVVKIIGSEGLLAVFVSGLVFNIVIRRETEEKQEKIQEVIKRFIDLPIFIFFGMILPWQKWEELGLPGIILLAAILLLRRLPAVLVFFPLIKNIKSYKDALFAGWFGPVGVAALYYSIFTFRNIKNENIWVIASLVIFSSIIVHGITDSPFTKLYARQVN